MFLSIAVEDCWRGSILDTVRTVASLPLLSDAESPSVIDIGVPFGLKLSNGETMFIWCARTPRGRYVVDMKYDGKPYIHLESDAPISSQLRLPDGKIYELRIRIEA